MLSVAKQTFLDHLILCLYFAKREVSRWIQGR